KNKSKNIKGFFERFARSQSGKKAWIQESETRSDVSPDWNCEHEGSTPKSKLKRGLSEVEIERLKQARLKLMAGLSPPTGVCESQSNSIKSNALDNVNAAPAHRFPPPPRP